MSMRGAEPEHNLFWSSGHLRVVEFFAVFYVPNFRARFELWSLTTYRGRA